MATLVIIKNSKVTGDVPTTLSPGELAINIVDGKLYYGDTNKAAQLLISSAGVVNKIIAGTNVTISPTGGTGNVTINASGGGSTSPGGSNTQIQYNNAGAFGGVSNLTWNGTTLSATGSFTGSFTGSLLGTSSYALTASYALNSGVAAYNTMTGSYGSFYDTGSVLAASATQIYSMSLSNTDISNGVFVSGSDRTRIKFTNAGIYNVQFSAQFSNTDNSTQDAIIWVRKNGTDIVDSSGVVGVPSQKAGTPGQAIGSWNYYLNLSANDYVQLCWHVEQANVITLETIAAGTSPTHPRTPSLILTANRIDTFLSNTGSFSGSFTGQFTGSLFGTSSYALTASYALNGGGGGSGITSLNGLTGAAQTLVTGSSGTNFNISSSGTVHTFNLPDASITARGVITTGVQDINGRKSFLTDIAVNGVNIGAGPGGVSNNVRIGRQAGDSLTSGSYNIFIGNSAADTANTTGSTVIGSNTNPLHSSFNQDYTLNIGKRSNLFDAGTQPPQYWSPDRISVPRSTNDIILRITNEIYSAVFIDYVISYEDTSLRAGTIKAVWDKNGVVKWTEDSTDSIGDMSTAIFDLAYDAGGFVFLRLTNNNSSTDIYCNFTSRLLLKPILY